ncbi:uncharacterized protein [Leuresthes tenuis]|uniref:uncharacterized protein n=1 Tax=Leuresthes tenuis TaxID=355514 RepID=UPI003B502AB7
MVCLFTLTASEEMELKGFRSLPYWVFLMLLFSYGSISASSASDNKTDLHLDCYFGCEDMFCHFQPQEQNCSDYSLTVRDHFKKGDSDCKLQSCHSGLCCCSVQISFVRGDTHSATVRKRGKVMQYKEIQTTLDLKPQTPTIISLRESNGNLEVKWRSGESCNSDAHAAEVTYYKKGDRQAQKHQNITPVTVEGLYYYEIPGKDLEPGTTYVVSVRGRTEQGSRLSDSSDEREFTTPADPNDVHIAVIVSLSFAAVIVTGAAFGCYKKVKAKWCDRVAKCPVPEFLDSRPVRRQELLKPSEIDVSDVIIVPMVQKDCESRLEMPLTDSGSEIGVTSFSFSSADINAAAKDAIRETAGNSQFPFEVAASLSHSPPEFLCFDNASYSSLICPKECDSSYYVIDRNTCGQQVPACLVSTQQVILPKAASSLMTIDMSYQSFNPDSGRLSHAEDSTLSPVCCGTDTTTSRDLVS